MGGTLLALQVRQVAKEVFSENLRDFGVDVLNLIKVKTYRGGTLHVVAPSVVCAELHMRSGELVDDINKKLGMRIVKGLSFKSS